MPAAPGPNGEEDLGDVTIGGPKGLKVTGRLAGYFLIGAVAILAVVYAGYGKPNEILTKLDSLDQKVSRLDQKVVEVQVTGQAIVAALPQEQQRKAKKIIDERLAILRLATQP